MESGGAHLATAARNEDEIGAGGRQALIDTPTRRWSGRAISAGTSPNGRRPCSRVEGTDQRRDRHERARRADGGLDRQSTTSLGWAAANRAPTATGIAVILGQGLERLRGGSAGAWRGRAGGICWATRAPATGSEHEGSIRSACATAVLGQDREEGGRGRLLQGPQPSSVANSVLLKPLTKGPDRGLRSRKRQERRRAGGDAVAARLSRARRQGELGVAIDAVISARDAPGPDAAGTAELFTSA